MDDKFYSIKDYSIFREYTILNYEMLPEEGLESFSGFTLSQEIVENVLVFQVFNDMPSDRETTEMIEAFLHEHSYVRVEEVL